MKQKYIAIVAGTGSYNDLGVIRSLGEKKIPVYYVTNHEHVFPIHKSKYIVQTIYCEMNEKEFVSTIKSVCTQQHAHGVIFPTSDITALYLDRNYTSLKGYCSFSHAYGRLEQEMDKRQMVIRAETAELKVPTSTSADARELPDNINLPCIVKPLASAFGEKSDITICYSNEELISAAKIYVGKNNVNILIQDLVTDVKQEIAVPGLSLPDGEVIIKGVVNKRCIMGNGSTVYGEYSIDEHSNLYEKIKKYIRSVGYVGIFDMEFLLDNSGEYHFIECNYRNGAYGYAVTASGFNIPYIFYQSITSQPWDIPQRMRSIVFMEERSYILNLLRKRISLWQWLKNVVTSDVFLFFNIKDMAPYIRVPYFIRKVFSRKTIVKESTWKFNVIKEWNKVWESEHLDRWEKLLMQSPISQVFFHSTVAKIWVDAYLPLRKMTPLFVWGESADGNKVFLPLVLWKRDWKGAFVHTIIPIGYSDYDYHDPLFQNEPDEKELSTFWNELIALLCSFKADEILLSGFRDRCITSCGDGEWLQGEICPNLDLTKINSEDALMAFFSTKLRGDIRRQIRRLGEMGTLRFVEYASVKDIPDGLFEHFMEAHRMRWPDAYKAPYFHERLVTACSAVGPIHFSALMLDDTPIAWHLGFEYQGVYYYYMPAGNPDYQKQSPVKIHLYYLIVRAINKGYTLYDHLRGDETYKSGWSDGYQYVNDMLIHSGRVSSKIKHGLIKLKSFIR